MTTVQTPDIASQFDAVPAGLSADRIFAGDGEMRSRCREFDWASTPLGPVGQWSHSLRLTAFMVLNSRQPMFLFWGPEHVQLFNDAYRPSLGVGERPQRALGARAREFWTEIWDTIGPQIEQVMQGGNATWHEDQYLPIERNGKLEDVWWTYSYSPVLDDDGSVGGTLVVCQEATTRVRAKRELQLSLDQTAEARYELKAALFALNERAAHLRAIFDGTQTFISMLSTEGTVLEANRASLEFAGQSRDDVIGLPFWDAPWFTNMPGASDAAHSAVRRAGAGEYVRYEIDVQRGDGNVSVFDIALHPVRNADGAVLLLVSEIRDVTAHRAVERALQNSEARYRALFESLDQGFCLLQMHYSDSGEPIDYTFIEANPAFVRQTGIQDPVGKRARDLIPNLEMHWVQLYADVARSGTPRRFQAGSEAMRRWFDVFAFRSGAGHSDRVALLFTDITSAREAEQERERLLRDLQNEQSRLAYVFQHAPAFLAVLRGPEHIFDLVNDAYRRLVGDRELVGRKLFDALPDVRGQGFEELLDWVFETGKPYIGHEIPLLVARSGDGQLERRYVDLTYMPMLDANGVVTGVISHGTDVTEQVVARQDVERLLVESEQARADAEAARAEAEDAWRKAHEANRAKSEFLAVMSHELRTPLNAIGGYAELMEMGIRGPITALQREDLHRIQTSQRHLLGLINEVLNYAKLESGTVQYDMTAVLVRTTLHAAEALVAPQATARGLTLVADDCDANIAVIADSEKLRQVLINLLSNSVKFTEPGGRVMLTCVAHEETVEINVVDTGIGIPTERMQSIFDPFVQVRADLTRRHEGTGLGLAISRDLARGMGGDLRAVSTEGSGSTFTLVLPRATTAASLPSAQMQ